MHCDVVVEYKWALEAQVRNMLDVLLGTNALVDFNGTTIWISGLWPQGQMRREQA